MGLFSNIYQRVKGFFSSLSLDTIKTSMSSISRKLATAARIVFNSFKDTSWSNIIAIVVWSVLAFMIGYVCLFALIAYEYYKLYKEGFVTDRWNEIIKLSVLVFIFGTLHIL